MPHSAASDQESRNSFVSVSKMSLPWFIRGSERGLQQQGGFYDVSRENFTDLPVLVPENPFGLFEETSVVHSYGTV